MSPPGPSSSSRVEDREDRMLAYYINLIKQQEQQELRKPTSGLKKQRTVENSDNISMDSADAKSVDVKSVDEVVKTVVKATVVEEKPRAETGAGKVAEKTTPKKFSGAKQLELAEAERIIATIMDRRPGRPPAASKPPAEAVPVVEKLPKEEKRKSAKISPPEDEPMVEVTAPPPQAATTSSRGRKASVVEKKVELAVAAVVAAAPVVEELHVQVAAAVIVEEVVIADAPVAVSETRAEEEVMFDSKPISQSEEVTAPPKKASGKSRRAAGNGKDDSVAPVIAKEVVAERKVEKEWVFKYDTSSAVNEWWKRPVGLQVMEYEEELEEALVKVKREAEKMREKLEVREESNADFLDRLDIAIE